MLRLKYNQKINDAFRVNPIVAILGPRQCGKTTLARSYISGEYVNFARENYFDLESTIDLERFRDPELMLSNLFGIIVIDEIQRMPELFTTLRVLVDRPKNNSKFLILGSASRNLIRQASESLAGRISYIELTPFNFDEARNLDDLWIRGGFPRSYLAENENSSNQWRMDYIRTFLEQDIPNLGIQIAPNNLRRFWMMLTHYHANIFNASEIGRSLGLSHSTIRHYLDILSSTFMVRQLQPWFENISKRQVKSSKIYFRDSGIFHTLLNVDSKGTLLINPKLGASWEGFALEEVIRCLQVDSVDCYFWATHTEAELDLLIVKGGKRLGFEFKYSDKPRFTNSMKIALQDLQLDSVTLIYPGDVDFPLAEKARVMGLKNFLLKNYNYSSEQF